MKKILSALMLCFVSIVMFSQEITETAIVFPEYQGVVTSNIPASDLYNKAKLWIAENFQSSNNVVDFDSPETSTIIVKGITRYNAGKISEMRILFTLKIEGKENRFRYTLTITDITAPSPGPSGYQSGYHLYAKNPQGKNVTKFSEDFRKTIQSWMNNILNTSVNTATDDEW